VTTVEHSAQNELRVGDWTRLFVIPLLVGTLAGSISLGFGAWMWHRGEKATIAKSASTANQQEALTQLTKAYRAFAAIPPAGASIGSLTTDEKRNLEGAMTDLFLYGNTDVRAAAQAWFKSGFKKPVEGILTPLRDQVRTMNGLDPIKLQSTPWVQTFWRSGDPSAKTPPPTTVAK
jgi:hypothetical protein